MAGSYKMCVGEDGKFNFEMIENMGDAYEACKMMFFMINDLAEVAEIVGGSNYPKENIIKDSEDAYYISVNQG